MAGGKPHATQKDHHDLLPTPPATNSTRSLGSRRDEEEDFDREPESSEEEQVHSNGKVSAPPTRPQRQRVPKQRFVPPRKLGGQEAGGAEQSGAVFKAPRQVVLNSEQAGSDTFRPAVSWNSPATTGSKRGSDDDRFSSDNDSAIFSSQSSSLKRPRLSPTKNLHAKPSSSYPSKPKSYGRKASVKENHRQERVAREQASEFKKVALEQNQAAPAPKFAEPRAHRMYVNGRTSDQPQWQEARSGEVDGVRGSNSSPYSSPLSSVPDGPGVEEVQRPDLPPPNPYPPIIECSICGHDVERLYREQFDDDNGFSPGRQLSYRWQHRFCSHHKKHEGKQVWQDKRYPEIDWSGLGKRMRRHNAHLAAVIDGSKSSYHREQLKDRVKERSAAAALNSNDGKRGMLVGYYGPRGEKIM